MGMVKLLSYRYLSQLFVSQSTVNARIRPLFSYNKEVKQNKLMCCTKLEQSPSEHKTNINNRKAGTLSARRRVATAM
jgi:hypothetical protein